MTSLYDERRRMAISNVSLSPDVQLPTALPLVKCHLQHPPKRLHSQQLTTAHHPLDLKFNSIGPIYYEYGSMVITYEDASKAVRALLLLREARYEDKHLLGKARKR